MFCEEHVRLPDVQVDRVPAGEDHRVGVNREGRRGDNRRVARPHQGQAHVAETFLRADRRDDFGRPGSSWTPYRFQYRLATFDAEVLDPVGDGVAVVLGVEEASASLSWMI